MLADIERFGALVIGPGLGRQRGDGRRRRAHDRRLPRSRSWSTVTGCSRSPPTTPAARRGSRHAPARHRAHPARRRVRAADRSVARTPTGSAPRAGLADATGCVVLLKGPTTIVAAPDGRTLPRGRRRPTARHRRHRRRARRASSARCWRCRLPAARAAAAGAWIHARCGASLARLGLVAGDLIAAIPHVLDCSTDDAMTRPRSVLARAGDGGAVAVSAYAVGADRPSVDAPHAVAVRVDPPVPTPALVLGDSALAALNWVPRRAGGAARVRRHARPRGVPAAVLPVVRQPAAADRVRGDRRPRPRLRGARRRGRLQRPRLDDGDVVRARSSGVLAQLGYRQIVWLTLRAVDSGFAARNAVIRDQLATGKLPRRRARRLGPLHRRPAAVVRRRRRPLPPDRRLGGGRLPESQDGVPRAAAVPVPISPGAAPPDPCPDPDVDRADRAIESLYPIGSA